MIPILYLSHCGSSIGGGEKQLAYLVTNIDRTRYRPTVVCPDNGIFAEHLRDADIPTVILNLPAWRQVKSFRARYRAAKELVSLAKAHNTHLVHTSDSWFNPYLSEVRKHLGIPVVSHVRNLLTPTQVRKYGFERMDGIISISEESSGALIQAGIDTEKIDVIRNCVDISAFQPSPEPTTAASREYVVGIVGRIEPFKQQKIFVEIAARVATRCKRVTFHIIGAALDTVEHRRYEQQVRQSVTRYGLEPCVHFMGHRTDMPRAMQELDLLVTLSAGSVIAEAMAAGKPVIGTPVGSAGDMIVHGVTGYLVSGDPIAETADRVIELAKDLPRSVEIGKQARAHAEKTFGIETHVQKIQGVYERLLRVG